MKVLRKAAVLLFLVAICMVQVAEATDPRSALLAKYLDAMSSESGGKAAVCCFVKKYEVNDLYAETKKILFGISPEYTPAIRGTSSSKVPTGLDGSYVKMNIYVSHENVDLASDPRIIEEMEVLSSLGTFEEKVREINRFVSRASYDYNFNEAPDINEASATALGCLNGLAICQGYANLGTYLYDAVGIENVKVWCSVKDKASHLFNVVRDEAGTLYAVDSTFYHSGHDSALISLEEYQKQFEVTFEVEPELLFYLRYLCIESGEE